MSTQQSENQTRRAGNQPLTHAVLTPESDLIVCGKQKAAQMHVEGTDSMVVDGGDCIQL